ncbi:serine hydrolase domain-containing protein [Flagellimonas okinawensis]|uniref:serine hydrolase domain-containing protein n=1 Tax=Flagellimonas okinawensis TaxID=3031324 RepID=UPI0023D85B1E|nr:serine hydrolase domain-containing protein [[Muricauda] okinawensis]
MGTLLSHIKKMLFGPPEVKPLEGLHGQEKAETIFNNLIAEDKVPGLAVTILNKGQVVLQKGYGFADLDRKIEADAQRTVFRIASISKCITGLALGKMVEDGMIDLDESFYTYVPYYPQKKYDFTLRQLASHTAGIRGYRGKEFALNQDLSIKDGIKVFKDDPLFFKPGNGYLYNSFDFVLLSLAMQEASGVSFPQYVNDNILTALGLKNTCSPKDMGKVSCTLESNTQFYTRRSGNFLKAVEVNNAYKLAGGGYLSTCEDIAILGQAILERKLLKNETYEELLASQIIEGEPTYYGLGFQVSRDFHGRKFIGHIGSSVGAYTNLFIYPEQEIVIVILINCTDPKIQTELDLAITSIFEAVT